MNVVLLKMDIRNFFAPKNKAAGSGAAAKVEQKAAKDIDNGHDAHRKKGFPIYFCIITFQIFFLQISFLFYQ